MKIQTKQITPKAFKAYYTQSNDVVTMPAYFQFWLPHLGPELAWVLVGLLQISIQDPTGPLQLDPNEVAKWIPLDQKRIEDAFEDFRFDWFVDRNINGQTHFCAEMPMTPEDTHSLREWLQRRGIQKDPQQTLTELLEDDFSVSLLRDRLPENGESVETALPLRFSEVVLEAAGLQPPELVPIIWQLAEELRTFFLLPHECLTISRYFLKHWLPLLGPAKAWLVPILRHQCRSHDDVQERENHIKVYNGAHGIARMLGVDLGIVQKWFPPLGEPAANAEQALLANFVEKSHESMEEVLDSWECVVTLDDPLIPADQEQFEKAASRLGGN